jgi:hypothetical protein
MKSLALVSGDLVPPPLFVPSHYLCLAIHIFSCPLRPAFESVEQISGCLRHRVGDAVRVVNPHRLPRALKRSGHVARIVLGESRTIVHLGIFLAVDAEGIPEAGLGEQQDRRLGPARLLFIVLVRVDADGDLSIGIGGYEARSPQPRHPAIALRPDDLYELPLPVKHLH